MGGFLCPMLACHALALAIVRNRLPSSATAPHFIARAGWLGFGGHITLRPVWAMARSPPGVGEILPRSDRSALRQSRSNLGDLFIVALAPVTRTRCATPQDSPRPAYPVLPAAHCALRVRHC